MKNKYNEKLKFLYMDADSLIMEIKTKDFYDGVKSMKNDSDTSDYPKDNIYNIKKFWENSKMSLMAK